MTLSDSSGKLQLEIDMLNDRSAIPPEDRFRDRFYILEPK